MPLFGSKKKKQKAEGEADGAAEAEASSSSSSSGVKRQLSKKEQKALEKEAKKEQKEKEKQEKAAKKAASKKEKQQRKESKKASKKASKKGSKKGSKKKDKKHQRRMGAQKVHRGRLFVRLDIAKNKLVAQVDEARDFHTVTKNDDANPYAVISIGPVPKGCDAVMKQQTKVVKGARKRAVFEQTFTFDISAITAGMRDNTRLRIELLHDAGRKRGTFLGGMAFTLNEIEDDDTPTQGWFRFLDEKKAINQNEPFRVMRKKEITKEIQELYGDVYGNKKPEERTYEEPVPAVDDAELIESSGAVGGKKKVGIDSFTYLQVLGRGAFGKVLLAELNDTKDIYAVKVLSKEAVIEDDDVEATMIERRVLSVGAECPCLTGLYATFQTPERLYFVMEFIKGGDLMFHASNLGSFTEPQAQLLLAEVCCGLWFLHDRGIVYRDLKLDNVMLTGDGHAKLADFGLCKEGIWGAATTTTFCGTPGYLAPEIIQELPYGVSVDWWSLGVMAYEMMIGETPFDGDDEEEIFEAVLSAPLEFHASISAHARSLVTGWLQRDPKQRLGSDSAGKDGIKQHPCMKTTQINIPTYPLSPSFSHE
ncbi:serine/threonine protein kinase [Salpingoeca rosetta]|uniref:Serine/threonine protein kinase n=1 Tax=Salpingoeca rosetta (strain ATCC 50818 / BSB-021) TaxID=946362 RepID=F2UQD2_SALR5|nr:serine/threonine protein kinase [Salpingoeca rosetta]EGD79837.1 serine/threonine protein kinase [Salpingoeca rosetta]|eukprot:XP_004988458.1 serine/threonine protein kinase [Salpingoeca rosetta]